MFKFSNALDSYFPQNRLGWRKLQEKKGELALSVVLIRIYVCRGIPRLPVLSFDSKLPAFLIKAITTAMKISRLYFCTVKVAPASYFPHNNSVKWAGLK